MREGGTRLFLLDRKRHPSLDAMHRAAFGPRALEPFRMGDAAPRRHPIDLARANGLFAAQTVAVHDLAVEQIGDGGKADMRVRAYVHLARNARRKFHRTEMIEEDEGTDHLTFGERQDAAHLESSEVFAPLLDHHVQHAVLVG